MRDGASAEWTQQATNIPPFRLFEWLARERRNASVVAVAVARDVAAAYDRGELDAEEIFRRVVEIPSITVEPPEVPRPWKVSRLVYGLPEDPSNHRTVEVLATVHGTTRRGTEWRVPTSARLVRPA